MKRVSAGIGFIVAAVVAFSAAPVASGAPAGPGDPVKGKVVYAAQKCSVCHKIGTTGGKLGPELTMVGTKRDAAWLAKYLPNPKAVDPKNKMPVTKAKGQDLDDLIAYLLTLKK
jgi:cytochrome c2